MIGRVRRVMEAWARRARQARRRVGASGASFSTLIDRKVYEKLPIFQKGNNGLLRINISVMYLDSIHPYYKSVEIKYAHMIAKGSAAKLTLGAPR